MPRRKPAPNQTSIFEFMGEDEECFPLVLEKVSTPMTILSDKVLAELRDSPFKHLRSIYQLVKNFCFPVYRLPHTGNKMYTRGI